MTDTQKLFDHLVRNDLITYDSIRKIVTGKGGNFTTFCILDYNYFKHYYKMIAMHLNKQQALDANPKAVQKANFTGNLENNAGIYFITEEANWRSERNSL